MTLDEAIKIVDPDTRHEALAMYAGDCDMLHAKAVEASRIVADALRAAMDDIKLIVSEYQCYCMVCKGGLGLHDECVHEEEDTIPNCNDCGQCICAGCDRVDKHFVWRGEA